MIDSEQGHTKKEECLHEELYFGSGDFYVICESCNRFWIMADAYEHNVGAACTLSGEKRTKQASE